VDDETITVRCVCGWETTGGEDDVIVATTEHGRRLHNMTPTRDEVLAMAVPRARDSPPGVALPESPNLHGVRRTTIRPARGQSR
jgi:predicted small metal-binding protein